MAYIQSCTSFSFACSNTPRCFVQMENVFYNARKENKKNPTETKEWPDFLTPELFCFLSLLYWTLAPDKLITPLSTCA